MGLIEGSNVPGQKDIRYVHVCHSGSAVFDDPNLVSCAGLVPVVSLAERAGLHQLIGEHVRVPGTAGSNPVTKVVALIAGMIAGADNLTRVDLGGRRII